MNINVTWFADIKTFFIDRGSTSASFKCVWILFLTTFFFFYVYLYNPTVRRLVWTHLEKNKQTYVILERVYLHIKYKLLGMLSWVLRLWTWSARLTCKRKETSEIMLKMPGHVLFLPKNQQVNISFHCWFGQATNTLGRPVESSETLQLFFRCTCLTSIDGNSITRYYVHTFGNVQWQEC